MEENTPPVFTPPPPPPPLTPPPVIMPSPRPPRRGRGWMVFALVLLVLLVFSFFINLSHFAGGFARGRGKYPHSFGPKLEEVLTEDNEAVNKIAVLAIEGIITSRVSEQGGFSLADVIKAELKHAGDDNKVRAIILKVDSPGGEVLASDEIYREIADFQKLPGGKPVIASMGNLAASGGYYVSAPCQWIVANDLTITGSIGVIMHSWNYRGLMNKVGLRPETYKSGKFKDMLSGERNPEEIPPEEREMVQSLIDETYGKFKKVVGEGRKFAHDKNKDNKDKMDQGTELSPHWTDYADGRVLSGTEAHQLGFVDQLGNFADAVKRAKTIAGISEANLIEYQQRYDLSDILRLFGQTGQTQSRVVKVDLGMDVPKLQAGQLYFLSPTFTH